MTHLKQFVNLSTQTPLDARYDRIAEIYETTTREKKDDLEFYLKLLQEECSCLEMKPEQLQVLELGSGTGRVGGFLSSSGFSVLGVDISQGMQSIAKIKYRHLIQQGRLEIEYGDMVDLKVNRRFHCILIPYSGFAHISSFKDQLSVMLNAITHLEQGGAIIISMTNTLPPARSSSNITPPYLGSFEGNFEIDEDRVASKFCGHTWVDENARMRYDHVYRIASKSNTEAIEWIVNSFHLYHIDVSKFQRLFQLAGFTNLNVYGDYNFATPYSKTSRRAIYIARKPPLL